MASRADRGNALIDASFVWPILHGMSSLGWDQDVVLRRAGLAPDHLRSPGARITQRELARLVITMTRVSGDEFWGLLSRRITPGTFRTLCRLLIRSRDLRFAINDGCRFYHLVVDDFTLRFRDTSGTAQIWITDRHQGVPAAAPVHAVVIFFVYGLMCWVAGRKIPLKAVHHAFPSTPRSPALRPYYEAPLFFDCARTMLEFDSVHLSLPVIQDEQRLARFLASMPSALLVRFRNDATFSERVRILIQQGLRKDPSLEDVADSLMITAQTLRRRLAEEGKSFREIKDRVRTEAAETLLVRSVMSLDDIALEVGFSDATAFRRAFRRWTGKTPSGFRPR